MDPNPFAIDPMRPDLSRLEAIEGQSPAYRAAVRRVEWRHIRTLMDWGIPARDLCGTFGIVQIQGREMIVTDNARMRCYITGPIMAAMPTQPE